MATRKHSNLDDQHGKSNADKEQYRKELTENAAAEKQWNASRKVSNYKNNQGPSK